MTRRVAFLDRDGTICREAGYVNHPSRLRLAHTAAPALRSLRGAGFRLAVVTNQAGVARGRFSATTLEDTHARLVALLAREGVELDGIYVCMHHPDVGPAPLRQACDCRKPAPGMIDRAARDLCADLARSVMIGDTFADIGAARAAGVGRAVLLRSGYGRGELLRRAARDRPWPDYVADDLDGAVAWILAGDAAEGG